MTEKQKLRQEFFKEHVEKDLAGMPKIATAPHDLFEWFYDVVDSYRCTRCGENHHECLNGKMCYVCDNVTQGN